jgi:4-alpha-glucanotransferase
MLGERASGILLHPTSLPARGGIGDLGPAAYEFLDFLSAARQGVWQILPLSPLGYGNSPYSSISAFAGNELLISLERLTERGWLERSRLASLPDRSGAIDYDEVRAHKLPLLRDAVRAFLHGANGGDRARFDSFCHENAWWLEDFVLFRVLRGQHSEQPWNTWPRELAGRNAEALSRARADFADDLAIERAIQFAFFQQWGALRLSAHRRGIRIMGDVAIFVNFDSADVWTHRELFRVDEALRPEVVSGVPPDAFSDTGQLWGNPLYRWDVIAARGYEWWIQRMRWALAQCDLIRIDHFRGFESYWEVPAGEPTAIHGRWMKGPNDELFHALRGALGDLPFVAEDLGMITPEVHALRERLRIPGMRVLQFGFGDPGAHIYLPHRYEHNTVVYTGTHDNDTTLGWWKNIATPHEKEHARAYLGLKDDSQIHWAMLRAAEASIADLCIVPLQDVLGLGSDARMNTPSRPENNWKWRYRPGDLRPELAERLALIVEVCDRENATAVAANQESSEEFAA